MTADLKREINHEIPLFVRTGRVFVLNLPDEDGTKKKITMPCDSQLFRDFANLEWIGGTKSPLVMLREMGYNV
jgi:hypothetical protein